MDLQRVRIDAYLHPSAPPRSSRAVRIRKSYRDGSFDHLPAASLSALASAINRAMLLDTGAFNELLNTMLGQYGMYVTNISGDEQEYAITYQGTWTTQPALVDALSIRDWMLPAARVAHRSDPAHMQEVDDLIGNTAEQACLTPC